MGQTGFNLYSPTTAFFAAPRVRRWPTRGAPTVAVQATFESKGLKAGFHSIGSRVETKRFQARDILLSLFQAMGQLQLSLYSPAEPAVVEAVAGRFLPQHVVVAHQRREARARLGQARQVLRACRGGIHGWESDLHTIGVDVRVGACEGLFQGKKADDELEKPKTKDRKRLGRTGGGTATVSLLRLVHE
jgi:hypothetical protein